MYNVDFSSTMRLGSMAGEVAAVAMWLSCDALQVASLPNEANFQWLRQQLGWTNTIGIGNDDAYDFYIATGGHGVFNQQCLCIEWVNAQTNADAWLTNMDGDGRDPIAVSYGTNSSNCWSIHDSAKLADDVYNTARPGYPTCGQGQPAFYYCYEH
jgi:hypothetical protein